MRLGELIRYAAGQAPFFQRKLPEPGIGRRRSPLAGWPLMTLEELVAAKLENGDAYSLRLCQGRRPLVTYQLEYDLETPLYVGLDGGDLSRYAEALTRCWSLLGVRRGTRVAIFDYGTSPLTYLASSSFTPYLGQGAAEALGCLPICNDGVPQMSARALEIAAFVRPQVLFIRADCLRPFAEGAARAGLLLSAYIARLVVAENEGALEEGVRRDYQRSLRLPLGRLLRIDAALFLAAECPHCGAFHVSEEHYQVEVVGEESLEPLSPGQRGLLVVTNRFARVCPTLRYLSQVRAELAPPGCPREPQSPRLLL